MYIMIIDEKSETGKIKEEHGNSIIRKVSEEFAEGIRSCKKDRTLVFNLDNIYYSYDRAALEKILNEKLIVWRKKDFVHAVEAYLNRNHYSYRQEVSEWGSIYYHFQLRSTKKTCKVRISNHPMGEISVSNSADFRYDKDLHMSRKGVINLVNASMASIEKDHELYWTRKLIENFGKESK